MGDWIGSAEPWEVPGGRPSGRGLQGRNPASNGTSRQAVEWLYAS